MDDWLKRNKLAAWLGLVLMVVLLLAFGGGDAMVGEAAGYVGKQFGGYESSTVVSFVVNLGMSGVAIWMVFIMRRIMDAVMGVHIKDVLEKADANEKLRYMGVCFFGCCILVGLIWG